MKKIIYVVLIILLLSGCKSNEFENNSIKEVYDQSSPSYKLNEYIVDLKTDLSNGVYDALNLAEDKSIYLDNLSKEFLLEAGLMLSDFDYKINSQNIDNDQAIINVTFYTYDYPSTIKTLIVNVTKNSIFSSGNDLISSIENSMLDELKKIKEKGHTKEISRDFTMSYIDNKWEYNTSLNGEALADGVSGGMITSIKNLSDVFGKIDFKW